MERYEYLGVLPDREGFPTSPLGCYVPSPPSRDRECGEVVGQKVVTLRRPPEEHPRRLRINPRAGDPFSTFSLLREHQRFSGFRVKDALAQRGSLRLRKGAMTYSRRPALLPQYEMCLTREGAHGTRASQLRDFRQIYGRWEDGSLRRSFRVPQESLPNRTTSPTKKNEIRVKVWEEFLLGCGALKKHGVYHVEEQTMMIQSFKGFLEEHLSKTMAILILTTIYFIVNFVACVSYSNYAELFGYIIFHNHLRLHECAYENNVNLVFTGSVFQSPAFYTFKPFCQHCTHSDNVKVFNGLMKQMRKDILTKK